MDIANLEKKIQTKFKNKDLLKTALTHRSYLNENRSYSLPHNERLEFLGDAVLELVTTEYLYTHFENPEGELTNLRSSLVNHRILAKIGKDIDLESHLLLSRGESKDTGRAREAILANTIEAVIGAIYLDQGIVPAKQFITDFILVELPEIMKKQAYLDPKSQLQELVQERLGVTPRYEVLDESGPDHDKSFVVGVYNGEKILGEGEGPSKREAEVEAAKDALENQNL
jgi:ribonuclease-3